MVFNYYHRLNRSQKAIYRKSDAVERIILDRPESLGDVIAYLEGVLAGEDRKRTESASKALVDGITADLKVAGVKIKVLSARPSNNWGELHGLYEPAHGRESARITVWMRTAKHKRVVAFKSFLRTIFHELCHHLDYEYLDLKDSFHTEGFFKRESSLFKQLVRGGN